ncbi:MAG: M14 family zinc carboxypeptidase [Patescibacteria group bacterium]
MKKIIIGLVVVGIIGAGVYFFIKNLPSAPVESPVSTATTTETKKMPEVKIKEPVDTTKTVLGTSVEKRDITAHHYGAGSKELLFVGGIHGGYEWNTVLLAYELMDYLTANPTVIPANLKVTVIPVLNPDGLNKVVGTAGRFAKADVSTSHEVRISGRFNANTVDLSRNFDCDWQPKGQWMTMTVSGGSKVFSEPESLAFKNYIEAHNPTAVVVWYSSAGGVFSSSCNNGVVAPATKALTDTYATASKYKAYSSYDFYKTTGDMVNWLAKKNIPAISVLLTTHQDTEWDKNLAGIKALLKYYAK